MFENIKGRLKENEALLDNELSKIYDIFDDDYGQQFYFYYKGHTHGCGTYNLEYEEYVKYIIDKDLDEICDLSKFDDRFFGAYCRYANHEHTKVDFTFRGELIDTYGIDESDPNSIEKICQKCVKLLEKLFNNPEFIKMEEERIASGDLYFNELVKKEIEK